MGGGGSKHDEERAEDRRRYEAALASANAARDLALKQYNDSQSKQEKDQKEHKAAMEKMEKRFNDQLEAYQQEFQKSQEEVANLQKTIAAPIEDRKKKAIFVNNLQLKIKQSKALALVGPKGSGKSTFLWLRGVGAEPVFTTKDGTVEFSSVNAFLDTIGIVGWSYEDLLKTLVMMIYQGGLPQDVVIFVLNSRVTQPISMLNNVKIFNPMVCVVSNKFWENHKGDPELGIDPSIHLLRDPQGVRRVVPPSSLAQIYDLRVHKTVKDMALATPVTHHDPIDKIMADRAKHDINPFGELLTLLGGHDSLFTVDEVLPEEKEEGSALARNQRNLKELIFQFIYIYEKKYKNLTSPDGKADGPTQFMNKATLAEFKQLHE